MNLTCALTQVDIELLDALDAAGPAALSAVTVALAAVMSATATAAAQRAALGLGTAALSATGDFDAAGAAAAVQALAVLLAGRAGGQTIKGGTAASENLVLSSTNHATKGLVESLDDLAIVTAGKGLQIKEGANAKMGTAVLVAGTLVVATTAAKANSRILMTVQVLGTVATPMPICVSARSAGVSFTILSSDNTDTSTIAWFILDPA